MSKRVSAVCFSIRNGPTLWITSLPLVFVTSLLGRVYPLPDGSVAICLRRRTKGLWALSGRHVDVVSAHTIYLLVFGLLMGREEVCSFWLVSGHTSQSPSTFPPGFIHTEDEQEPASTYQLCSTLESNPTVPLRRYRPPNSLSTSEKVRRH